MRKDRRVKTGNLHTAVGRHGGNLLLDFKVGSILGYVLAETWPFQKNTLSHKVNFRYLRKIMKCYNGRLWKIFSRVWP